MRFIGSARAASLIFLVSAAISSVIALEELEENYIGEDKSEGAPVFALFVNDVCTQCKALETALEQISTNFTALLDKFALTDPKQEEGSMPKQVRFAKVNMSKSTTLSDNWNIQGAPTLILLRNKQAHEYGGSLDPELLAQWAAPKIGPLYSRVLRTDDDEKTFVAGKDVAIVLEASLESANNASIALEYLRDQPVYARRDLTAGGDSALKDSMGKLRVYKWGRTNFTEIVVDCTNATQLQLEVIMNQVPLFGEITLTNLDSYIYVPRPLVWFVSSKDDHIQFREEVKPLLADNEEENNNGTAKKMPRLFHWVYIDPHTSDAANTYVKKALAPQREGPNLIISDLDGPGRFHMREDPMKMTWTEIRNFVLDVIDGKIERNLNSMPEPLTSITDDGIHLLVGKTVERWFKEKEESKSIVALILDTPYCQNCQQLANKLSKLKKEKDLKCLEIGRIDALSNELDPKWGLQPLTAEVPPQAWIYNQPQKNLLFAANKIPLSDDLLHENLLNLVSCNQKDEL